MCKRVLVELSPQSWPPHVREKFEENLYPLFSAGLVEGMQMSFSREAENPDGAWDVQNAYVWRAWGAAETWKHATHRFEYRFVSR